jgi:CBS domain-containing protein
LIPPVRYSPVEVTENRRESLSVMEENGRLTGIFIGPDIFATYLSRKIVQEIEPVEKSPKGTRKGRSR